MSKKYFSDQADEGNKMANSLRFKDGDIKPDNQDPNKSKSKMVTIMGYTVREGSKQHAILIQQKKHYDDLARHEQG